MSEHYLPPELWRVAIKASGRGYGDPASKTYARESVAREYAERARECGYEVALYRCEPTWAEVEA
jgi:hypothetical protein